MTGLIDISISELTAMATKAARGAGFGWGMADEAARATCWLAARDLPGPAALAELLERLDGQPMAGFAPLVEGDMWSASGGWLCPVATAAAMLDRADHLSKASLTLGPTLCPLLLRPAVADIWPGGAIVEPKDLTGPKAAQVRIAAASAEATGLVTSRARLAPDVWNCLGAFAQRTYAPATEASRLAGAGAGLSDND